MYTVLLISLIHHITHYPVAVKQLINNACQLKLQSGVSGVTILFINYNINVSCLECVHHYCSHLMYA